MLANSDSEADQNVKKQVRDAVGAYIEPYLLECENIEETRATVNDHMDEIIAVSKETLAANGFTYGASAELTHTCLISGICSATAFTIIHLTSFPAFFQFLHMVMQTYVSVSDTGFPCRTSGSFIIYFRQFRVGTIRKFLT